jgi:hypothetical protein
LKALKNKTAWIETFVDVGLGSLISFPLNMVAMWIIFITHMNILQSSVFLWAMFTFTALIRKYWIRIHFENIAQKKR